MSINLGGFFGHLPLRRAPFGKNMSLTFWFTPLLTSVHPETANFWMELSAVSGQQSAKTPFSLGFAESWKLFADSANPKTAVYGWALIRVFGYREEMVKNNKREKGRKKKGYQCTCCGKKTPFCWTCPCGFQICNGCMEENLWGFTCSGVNWQCPDCGSLRPF